MNRSLLNKIGLVFLMSLILTGCQTQQNTQGQPADQNVNNISNSPSGSDGGIPSLTQQDQPQAITETEQQKFTLN